MTPGSRIPAGEEKAVGSNPSTANIFLYSCSTIVLYVYICGFVCIVLQTRNVNLQDHVLLARDALKTNPNPLPFSFINNTGHKG